VVAGNQFTASVVVDRRSGGPTSLVGCPFPVQVALANRTYQPTILWPTCRAETTLQEGVTTLPVVVRTDVAPGRYHAEMFLGNSDPPIPPARPVTITVRAAAPNR
jgi:hypothetical protein